MLLYNHIQHIIYVLSTNDTMPTAPNPVTPVGLSQPQTPDELLRAFAPVVQAPHVAASMGDVVSHVEEEVPPSEEVNPPAEDMATMAAGGSLMVDLVDPPNSNAGGLGLYKIKIIYIALRYDHIKQKYIC